MKETRVEHQMWKNLRKLPKKMRDEFNEKLPPMMGKWYYYYENENGKVGLVRLNDFVSFDGKKDPHHFEACGHLDYERFKTKRQAEIAIYKCLKEPYLK